LERYDDALASYDRALWLNPDIPQAWNNRGNALRRLGQRDEAIASYDHALDLNPNYGLAKQSRESVLKELTAS
jgi:tetratricopeptide (TPR) repeat protein